MAKIFHNDYSKTVYPTYTGDKPLYAWAIYDVNENLLCYITPDAVFVPESDGKYYFVAIFADAVEG